MEAVKTRKVGKEGDSSGLKRENLGVKIAAHIIMVIAAVLAVLPFLMMISSSITSEEALARYGYGFIPMEVSFDAYSYLFKAWSTIGKAYFITIASTVSGTFLHMLVTTNREMNGLHIWEDNVIVEIIDPETLEPVPEGEVGELVLTTINREAMPLLRYRTRDLTCILPGDCPCGRTHKRLARFKGRSDDMIILKGVNLFPIQIEKILMNFKELGSNYLITIETIGNSDEMLIEVELSDLFTDDYSVLQRLTKEITRQLKDELLLTPRIRLVAKGSLPTGEGKAVRVKDLRKLC